MIDIGRRWLLPPLVLLSFILFGAGAAAPDEVPLDPLIATDGRHVWAIEGVTPQGRARLIHHDAEEPAPTWTVLMPQVIAPGFTAAWEGRLWFGYERAGSSVFEVYQLRMQRHEMSRRWYPVPYGRLEPVGSRAEPGRIVAMGGDEVGPLLVVRVGDRFLLERPGPPPGRVARDVREPLQLPLSTGSQHITLHLNHEAQRLYVIADVPDAGSDVMTLEQNAGWYRPPHDARRIDWPVEAERSVWAVHAGRLLRWTAAPEADQLVIEDPENPGEMRLLAAWEGGSRDPHAQRIMFARRSHATLIEWAWRDGARQVISIADGARATERMAMETSPPRARHGWPAAAAVLLTAILFGLEVRRAGVRRQDVERAKAASAGGRGGPLPPPEASYVLRAAAQTLDLLPILVIVGLLLGVSPIAWLGISSDSWRAIALVWVVSAALTALLGGGMEARFGATPGKAILRLQVMPAHGGTSPPRPVVRALVKMITLSLPIAAALGLLHPRGWCPHDVLGRTLVRVRGAE